MTTTNKKILKNYARDILGLQQQFLVDGIAESSNATAYAKLLDRTVNQLRTFDKRDPENYVDYVARDLQKQHLRTARKKQGGTVVEEEKAPKKARKKQAPSSVTVDDISIEEPEPKAPKITKKKQTSQEEEKPVVAKKGNNKPMMEAEEELVKKKTKKGMAVVGPDTEGKKKRKAPLVIEEPQPATVPMKKAKKSTV